MIQDSLYPPLNLPSFDIRIRPDASKEGKLQIFDRVRRKYVALTPEEYVRQHFCNMLIEHLEYPLSLLANEIMISVNNLRRRCDTVVFSSRDASVLAIAEYKSPEIKITESVFNQIVRYNMSLKAGYLMVSNGMQHFCCHIDYALSKSVFLPEIPKYKELLSIC